MPWVIVDDSRLWAWDPSQGLVAVDGLGDKRHVFFDWNCLHPDGSALTYRRTRDHDGQRLRPHLNVTYEFSSRTVRQTEARRDEVAFPAGGDTTILARYIVVDGTANGTLYVVSQPDSQDELPVRDLLGANFNGPPVQLSPGGTRVAISHSPGQEMHPWVTVTTLANGDVRRYGQVELSGSAAWNPSATSLLVTRVDQAFPLILDLESGQESSLRDVLDISSPPGLRPVIAGWLDDRLLLASQVQGRRLLLRAVDHVSGESWPLLDLPTPVGPRSLKGLILAPIAAQANPPCVSLQTPD